MKLLAESFNWDGFHFQLVCRLADVALFAKVAKNHSAPSYEVVFVRKRSSTIFPNGKTTPAHESMPSPEQWGTYGWTPGSWRSALDMFKSRCFDQGLSAKDACWLWPANPYVAPRKEWVLSPAKWIAEKGTPETWAESQTNAENASPSFQTAHSSAFGSSNKAITSDGAANSASAA